MSAVSELLEAAHEHLKAGAYEDAAVLLRQALNRAPSSVKTLKAYAACILAQGEPETATEVLRKALTISPDDAEALHDLGMAQYATGDLEGARTSLERALTLDPNNPSMHEGLGIMLAECGDVEGGLKLLLMSLSINPKNPSVLAQTGLLLLRIGALYDAKQYLDTAIEANPADSGPKLLLASVYAALERYIDALDLLEPLYLKQPRDIQIATALGAALCQVGRADEGMALIESVLKAMPNHLPAIEAYARATALAGDPDKGIRLIAGEVRKLQEPAVGYLVLAEALKQAGRLSDAVAAAKQGLSQPQFAPIAHEILLKCYALQGDYGAHADLRAMQRPDGEEIPAVGGKSVIIPFETKPLDVVVLSRLLAAEGNSAEVYAPRPIAPLIARMIDPARMRPLEEIKSDLDPDAFEPIARYSDRLIAEASTPFTPYLKTDPAHDETWHSILEPYARPLIGIAWNRYPPDAALHEILQAVRPLGGTLLSLIWEDDLREELEGIPGVIDAGYHFASMEACIDLMGQLDLVVAPDCLQLHIAGALGRPAVGLLRPDPAWYCHVSDGTLHWYPSVRALQRTWQQSWTDLAAEIEALARGCLAPD